MESHCQPLGRKQRPRQTYTASLLWGRSQRSARCVCSGCGLHSHATDVKAQGLSGLLRSPGSWGWWGRGPGEVHLFPLQKRFGFTEEITSGAAPVPPHPQVWRWVSQYLWPQDRAAPGWDVAGPAGDTEVIQKCFSEFPLALSLPSALRCFCLLLNLDQISFNYVVVRKEQGPNVWFQIN